MSAPQSKDAIFDFPHSLLHVMSRTNVAMWQLVTHKTHAMGGITGMQASVLLLLMYRHSATSMDLAREYKLHSSAITRLVDRLVRLELVERIPCENDRRATYLRATSRGRRISEQLPAIFTDAFETLFDGIDERDVDTLRRCLKHILLNARAAEELSDSPVQQDFYG
ncbi:TPA: MarR family winged helix-turn-helix transcriptional regulator [Burkholderia cenocepacia]|uniref:MarR family winged helix-turn-helix transcriptional regulator n=1 Tax=Burkholderia cepacia complex TaxID=87882 RepID=UPI0001D2576A|nr:MULTISPECIES: MarR family transcriptional regulator [Burkholderia cepacia complex]EIF30002.1 transcriptional regulator [Burkholderia sp. Ch1-1]